MIIKEHSCNIIVTHLQDMQKEYCDLLCFFEGKNRGGDPLSIKNLLD